MNNYHRKAIELKYKGYTHVEISKAIGGKLTPGTLDHHFASDGMLYLPYLEYSARQGKFIEDQVRDEFKEQARYASKIMRTLLQAALKAKDYRAALEIIKEQLDRAGVVTVKKSQVNVTDNKDKEISTYEQYTKELERMGIDPGTGLRLATPAVGAN